MEPLPFDKMIVPETGRMRPRKVDVDGETYECARRYMIRLEAGDFQDAEVLARLAQEVKLTAEQFRERFGYLVTPPERVA
jgi:6-phosphofructokinase 1